MADVPPDKVAELAQLLRQLLVPNTEVIRAAYESLKGFFRDRRVVVALMHILAGFPEWEVRQLAAVLLRQRLLSSWKHTGHALKAEIKQTLLARVAVDDKALVRQSIANIIAVVAKSEVAARQWPQLLGFLTELCARPDVAHREIGFYLLAILAEALADQLRAHLNPLLDMLATALRDPASSHVRTNALLALKEIGFRLSHKNEIERFRQTVPAMLQAVHEFAVASDDDGLSRAVEVFDELVECEIPILAAHMGPILNTFMQMACNKTLEEGTRIKALSFIAWAAEFKPKSVTKHKLTGPIVGALMSLVAEDDTFDEVADAGPAAGDRLGPVAEETLEKLSQNVPPPQIIPPLMELVPRMMASATATDRRAAMRCLAVVVEGCSDFLRPLVGHAMPIVLAGLRDSERAVQEAACFALARLGEFVQPEVSEHHPTVIPALFEVLNTSHAHLLERACMTLEVFCEQLGEHILPYIQPLMQKLVALLHVNSRTVQEVVVTAIGSVAHSAEQRFLPYLPDVIETMSAAMRLVDEQDITLRSLTTDTMGVIATAVGLEAFRPYINPLVHVVLDGLARLDEPRIRECSWGFFASLARLTEAQFAEFLPLVMPRLLESAQLNADTEVEDEEVEDHVSAMATALAAEGDDEGGEYEDDDDDDDDEPHGRYRTMAVLTTFVYEKEMAIAAIGEICLHVGQPFLPYVQESVQVLSELLHSHHSEVCQAAVVSLGQVLRAFNIIFQGGVAWEEMRAPEAPSEVVALANHVMPLLLAVLSDDDDIEVCTAVCHVVSDHLPVLGPVLLQSCRDVLSKTMLAVLTKTLPCQKTFDDHDDDADATRFGNDDDDDEQESERKALLIDAAADVIGATAGVLGPAFANDFGTYLPLLQKYYKPRSPVSDRSMAVGCVAEVVAGLKGGCAPFAQTLLPFFLKALRDSDDEVQRNAVYGLGCLCEGAPGAVVESYVHILGALHPFFARQHPQADELLDNACGAVCRMIVAAPSAVPLAEVVPVLLQHLPLREDFEEAEAVVSCLLLLVSMDVPVAKAALPSIVSVFARLLGPPMEQLRVPLRQRLIAAMRALLEQQRQLMNTIVAGLSADERAVLSAALSS